ncbi:MAG: NupC/NupG family nucleoside CNT transporter [Sandaracinaceae bacterium]|nr:NupC/NupG family nucleoside CNT transporter [Sandaracinaceae bacterium]
MPRARSLSRLALFTLLVCVTRPAGAQSPEAPLAAPEPAPTLTAPAEEPEPEAAPAPVDAPADVPEREPAPAAPPAPSADVAVPSAAGPAAVSLRGNRQSSSTWTERATSAFGLLAFIGLAWLMSSDRRRIPYRIVAWGLALQILFGAFALKTRTGLALFSFINDGVVALLGYTDRGTSFLFGAYASDLWVGAAQGEAGTFLARAPLAIKVLPTIIFFSALMAVLYHAGVMQRVVSGIAWVMQRTMRTSGSETLSAAANIFVGQTEAPLVIRPYLEKMTSSELMAVMVGGFATVAGGVLAAYVGMLQPFFPDIAGHLIAASVMSAPAALVIAKVMQPETQESETAGGAKLSLERVDANLIEAAARGASEGLMLALNVAAMLLAFVALVALANALLALPVDAYNHLAGATLTPITMEQILGVLFWPIAFLMGVDPSECGAVAGLLGEKIVLNEFVSYMHLAEMLDAAPESLSQRSVVLVTYALCGFANFSSIAIQVGGIGAIAPGRRADVARLGLRAMWGGALAACMTASVAGILI